MKDRKDIELVQINSVATETKEEKQPKWYFGGLATSGAVLFTHPMDLIKVHMQTKKDAYISTTEVAKDVVAKQGPFGLYRGISAAVLRQMTYSTTRFGVYEYGKMQSNSDGRLTFLESLGLAAVAGLAGSMVGNPADLINVRMQNDLKLPVNERRNYSHAFHGIYMTASKEGVSALWTGLPLNAVRSVFMNVGQITFYSQFKSLLLNTGYFGNNVVTHITSSVAAAVVATVLTLPVDVLKTRTMNAKPGEPTGIGTLIIKTAQEGPLAFFKGFVPSLIRMLPHTVLTFVFLEQLTKHFGISFKK